MSQGLYCWPPGGLLLAGGPVGLGGLERRVQALAGTPSRLMSVSGLVSDGADSRALLRGARHASCHLPLHARALFQPRVSLVGGLVALLERKLSRARVHIRLIHCYAAGGHGRVGGGERREVGQPTVIAGPGRGGCPVPLLCQQPVMLRQPRKPSLWGASWRARVGLR